jgi:hypothetical protein
MIIWRGAGVLIVLIVFGCSFLANLISNSVLGPTYYDQHKWPLAVSLVISAIICLVWGLYLKKRPDRIVIDKQTGQEMVLKPSRPALFFIPVLYWGPILFVIAIVVFVMEFMK